MTNSDSSDRDELVAAYLDGEATQAERAEVEADPELMSRVAVLNQIADMVAEPVVPPSTEVRNRHIAQALAASATAPNVTSMAKRRRWSADYTMVLGAAAAILVILFAGSLVLLNNDDGDSDATATADFDAGSAGEAPLDGAEDLGNTAADDAEDSDDSAAAAEAPAEEEAEEATADEPAEEPAPEAVAEEQAPAEEGDSADSALELTTGRSLAAGQFDDTEALAQSLSDELTSDDDADEGEGLLFDRDLQCADTLSALTSGQEPILIGTATIGNEPVEYVVVDGPDGMRVTILDTATCGIFDDVALPA